MLLDFEWQKNAGLNYDKIKRFMINDLPVPSQMILTSTIQKDKGFRSVVNKMIVQTIAKLGYIPWAIDDLPFSDIPTMLVGVDISGSVTNKEKQVFGMVATSDIHFSKYWSQSDFSSKERNIEAFIYDNLKNAITNFIEKNGVPPSRMIIFREGISKGQRVKTK